MLGVVVAAALWWVYFDVVAIVAARRLAKAAEGRERNEIARDSYSYLHFPMVAGIALIAVGMKRTIGHVEDPLKLVPAVALLGGAAMYLLAHVAFRLRNMHTLSRRRLVCAIVLLALLPAGAALPALVTLGILAALLGALIAYEALRYAEARDRVRHRAPGGARPRNHTQDPAAHKPPARTAPGTAEANEGSSAQQGRSPRAPARRPQPARAAAPQARRAPGAPRHNRGGSGAGRLEIAPSPSASPVLEHRRQHGGAEPLSLGAGLRAEHAEIPVGRAVAGMAALDREKTRHDQGQAREQARVQKAAGERRVLTGGRLPALRWRPYRRAGELGRGPDLLVGEKMPHSGRMEALERRRAKRVGAARPPRDRIVHERSRKHQREAWHVGCSRPAASAKALAVSSDGRRGHRLRGGKSRRRRMFVEDDSGSAGGGDRDAASAVVSAWSPAGNSSRRSEVGLGRVSPAISSHLTRRGSAV